MTKKKFDKRPSAVASSGFALAAAILATPVLATPTAAAETVHLYLKANAPLKVAGTFNIAGVNSPQKIYEDTNHNFFYLDPRGDKKFVLPDATFKFFRPNPKGDGTTE